jgi:hypothetical protein
MCLLRLHVHGCLTQAFLRKFHAKAAKEVAAAAEALGAAEKSFINVAGFFNGQGNKLDAAAFFQLLADISKQLEKAGQDNQQADDKASSWAQMPGMVDVCNMLCIGSTPTELLQVTAHMHWCWVGVGDGISACCVGLLRNM